VKLGLGRCSGHLEVGQNVLPTHVAPRHKKRKPLGDGIIFKFSLFLLVI
jgi:hypothetical protein